MEKKTEKKSPIEVVEERIVICFNNKNYLKE